MAAREAHAEVRLDAMSGTMSGTIATPISDLIAELLSQGLSGTLAVNAGRLIERKMAEATTHSGPDEQRRLYERDRKRAQRAAKHPIVPQNVPDNVPDTPSLDILLLRDSPESQNRKKEKKDISVSPNVPDILGQADDWPADYGDQFWDAYPPGRKQDKTKVFAKLGKLRAEGYLDAYKKRQRLTWAALVAGLGLFVATHPEPQFTPAPMVWLNGHRWDSDYGDRISKASGAENGKTGYGGQQGLGFAGIAALARRSANGKI